jgi:hypothetical protein
MQAEALIVILLASCWDLPSSPHHCIIQDIFGRLLFHARSSLYAFPVNQKGSGPSALTDRACLHLNGTPLSQYMGIPEEAFVRFVLIVDVFRYHYDDIRLYAEKYKSILGDPSYETILAALDGYTGTKNMAKVEKGYRNDDITFFAVLKSKVSKERGGAGGKPSLVFNYPLASINVKTEVKDESKYLPRNLKGPIVEELGMPLDDDTFHDCVGV